MYDADFYGFTNEESINEAHKYPALVSHINAGSFSGHQLESGGGFPGVGVLGGEPS